MYLVDGSNMLHRAMWHKDTNFGIHPLRDLYTKFISPQQDTVVVWDGMHSLKRRRDLFPGYKQRPEKEEDIKAAFDLLKEVLCHCNITQIEIPYWEADDVLATLAKEYAEATEVTIETNDQDFWQLADNPQIKLPLVKPLPCAPQYTCVYKSLVGDQSDKIPGWRGFGPKRWEEIEHNASIMDKCLQAKDYRVWECIPWPKGITPTEESFFQCCIFYEVVTMQDVPEEDFKDNFICGKSEPALAEEVFARWRI